MNPIAANKFYSDSQKIEAVTTYFLLGGNLSLTARKLNIPQQTMQQWKHTQWWKDVEQEIRSEQRLKLSTKLKKIVGTSWEQVEDRLEHGDYFYDQKAGEIKRKPVSLRDAGVIATQATKLFNDMEAEETHSVASATIEEKLEKLAKAFSDLANGKKLDLSQVEEIPFVEEVR